MKSHIALTIEELQARMQTIGAVIEALKDLDRPDAATPPPTSSSNGNGQERPAASPRRKPAAKAKAQELSRGAALEQGRRLLSLAAGLPEPFSTQDLARASGLEATLKPVYGALYRWTNTQKWVARIGKDQYRRTKSFPKVAAEASAAPPQPAAAARLTIPGLDSETIQEKLDRARRDLEDAKAANRSTMVTILTMKVKQLEAQLA